MWLGGSRGVTFWDAENAPAGDVLHTPHGHRGTHVFRFTEDTAARSWDAFQRWYTCLIPMTPGHAVFLLRLPAPTLRDAGSNTARKTSLLRRIRKTIIAAVKARN